LNRRRLGAGLLAGALAWPVAGAAQLVRLQEGWGATRLSAPELGPYTPPAKLSTVLDIYRRMTGSVVVAGAGPYPFVIDTGANQSVISAELAQQLGLALGDVKPVNGVAGVSAAPTTQALLQVGARPPRDAVLSVLPGDAMGAPGMLGLDQLDGARLTLDFGRQMLSIDSGPALPGAGDEVRMKAHRRDGQLTLVDADLAGISVTAFLDSGAQNTIGNLALRELAITRYPLTLWSKIPVMSVTGQTIDADFADLPALRIGGVTLSTWPVAFADLHTFRLWNLTKRPAILVGVDVLSRFETVCLDFRRDEVRFRLPQRA
jgi:predicted aspartyl protease